MIPSKTFCILPWLNAHLEADGRVRPCCMSADDKEIGNLHTSSLDCIMNSDLAKELRLSLLKGEEHELCRNCHLLESLGQQTLRNTYNEKHKDLIDSRIRNTSQDGSIPNINLASLDIRFSNLCNFKCRTCYEGSSSSWYQDANELRGGKNVEILRPTKSKDELWQLLDKVLPSLKEVYILGGEPLIDPDHYLFLEKLIHENRTDIELRYSTNLSTLYLGKKSALDYWKKFQVVTLSLSYDGVGEKGEFIRKGMSWDKTVENHKIIQNENIEFIITPTVSVLNAFHLIELIRYLVKEKMIISGEQVGLNILDQPSFYNVKILNSNEVKKLESIYKDFIENELKNSGLERVEVITEQLERLLNYCKKDTTDFDPKVERKKFVAYNSRLNKLRKENMLQLFPELSDIFLDVISNS